jgi:salicylate hydroxylase
MGIQLVWLPAGQRRDARDESLRAMMVPGLQGWDEDKLRLQWEEVNDFLGYSAREAAEHWWVNWGMLRERSRPYSTTLLSSSPIQGDFHGQETTVGS